MTGVFSVGLVLGFVWVGGSAFNILLVRSSSGVPSSLDLVSLDLRSDIRMDSSAVRFLLFSLLVEGRDPGSGHNLVSVACFGVHRRCLVGTSLRLYYEGVGLAAPLVWQPLFW